MSHAAALLLLSLLLFQVKHFVCDYLLQTTYLFRNKGIYGHRAGFIHAGIHVVGSLPSILIITMSPQLVLGILVAEFVVHYHVDWLKQWIDRVSNLTIEQSLYWTVFGADQLIHQLTYVAILAVLAQAAQL